jgi:dTDP-4-dehydrorhamnose 3,5-epimerase
VTEHAGDGPATSGTSVDGVIVQPLHIVRNERGHLQEIVRTDDGWFPGFGQVYATATRPGVVKAWYRHRQQTDVLTIVHGRLRFAVHDDRADSPTCGRTQVVEMGLDAPVCVVIPPMVWHGYQAIGPDNAVAVHVNSEAFVFDAPDEERREVDDPSMPLVWD